MPLSSKIGLIVTIILLAGTGNNSLSQTGAFNFEKLNTTNGLSSNRISSILQDRDGFYWISTEDGLNRFDGTSFKIFRNDRNDPQTIVHNNCNFLLEADNGDIWITTYNGLSVYRKNAGKFENYILDLPGIEQSILNRIAGIVQDREGKIWICSNSIWEYIPDENRFQPVPMSTGSANPEEQYPSVVSLLYDSVQNGLWFKSNGYINYYDLTKKKFFNRNSNPESKKIFDIYSGSPILIDGKNQLWFYSQNASTLCSYNIQNDSIELSTLKNIPGLRKIDQDNKGRIWLSFWTDHSIIYNTNTKTIDKGVFEMIHPYSAAANHFLDVYVDNDSAYWIGSSEGISILKSDQQFYELYPTNLDANRINPASYSIRGITEKNNNELFLGTATGLFTYNLKTREYKKLNIAGVPSTINCLYNLKSENKLWIGSHDEVVIYDLEKKAVIKHIPIKRFSCFIVAHGGTMWIGTWVNGLYQVNYSGEIINYYSETQEGNHFLKNDGLICGFSDNSELWIGMNGGNGLAKYDPSFSNFKYFELKKDSQVTNITSTINAIVSDKNKNLWIGTHGGGIYYWDRKNDKFTQYLQSDGMGSNFINNIIIDENENLWICHSNGVDYFLTRKQKFISVEFNLPFISNDFHSSAISTDSGAIYFFNSNTIVKVRSRKDFFAEKSSRLILSSFKIFGKEIPINQFKNGIELTYKQNFFTIEFSKLRTNPSEVVLYAFKLDGFDNDWNYPGGRNFASYTNVPGGNYTFHVKVLNKSGDWNEKELIIPVTISIPYWRTWWFIASVIVFISGIVILVVRYRIQQLRKVYLLRAKISQDLHDEVGATLSSIHVYSSVAIKTLNSDSEKSRDALRQINNNTRQVMENMNDIVWAINVNKTGSSLLEGKLKNYGTELLSPLNIQCHYSVDKDAEKKLSNIEARKNILLIAKEAINNIAKYSEATEAFIDMEIKNSDLLMEINDNGKGIDRNNNHKGNGLFNMYHRAKEMGGILLIDSNPDKGTSVKLRIPLAKISD